MKGYKFIQKDMKSKNGTDTKWRLNVWKKHKGDITLCEKGYHASAKPIDILEYIYGPRLFVVETRGKIIKGDNNL